MLIFITTSLRALLGTTLLCFIICIAKAQTLTINNDEQTYTSLTNTAVTLSGKSALYITNTGDPIVGCSVNLTSPDSWLYFPNILPSAVNSTLLNRIQVNGASAVLNTNCRIVQHTLGAVVIPHGSGFSPVEVYSGRSFTGKSKMLYQYIGYNDARLGEMEMNIRSLKLKHGYMVTLASNENGTGTSKVYIAQDGDLEIGKLPSALEAKIRFVRIFPWRWTSKKGICGNIESGLKVAWKYNWNLDQNSTLDMEYVPIKQLQYWPSLNQDWKVRGSNHLLGFNEPDQSGQANLSVATAIAGWPELLGTGLRVGAPAVSDGGTWWITDFMNQANANGLRVDFVPIHYYRSFWSASDPAGAATQMYNFLKGIYDIVQRPLWVTEFNNGASWTTDPDPTYAQQAATVAAMCNMLDNTPFVERYSIYNWVEDVRRVKWDDGSLTTAGVNYRDNTSPNAYLQEMPDSGVGHSVRYLFDGNFHDSVGNGHDAMSVGSPIFTTGKYGQAISLDGTSDYLMLSPRAGDTTDFTFSSWVYWNGGANWQRIFDFGNGTSKYLALSPQTGTGVLRFMIKNGGTEQTISSTSALPIGVWTHVAVTISGDTGKLFVNGNVVATNASLTINPVDVGTKYNYLGKSQFADPLFNGKIDDVRMYLGALSDAQIYTMATTAPPSFSNTTLTKLDATKLQPYTDSLAGDVAGGSGAKTFVKLGGPAWLAVAPNGSLSGVPTEIDLGTNQLFVKVTDANGAVASVKVNVLVKEAVSIVTRYNFDNLFSAQVGTAHGVASGSPAFYTGYTNSANAVDLDGTDDYISLPAGVIDHDQITIMTWLNWDGGSNWQRVFDFGNSDNEYMFLSPNSGAGTLRFSIKNDSTEQSLNGPMPSTGVWTHVAITLNGSQGKLYLNGTLMDTQPITIKPSDIAAATNYIGKSQFAADPYFNGRLDNFLIYNGELTSTQINLARTGRPPIFTSSIITKTAATVNVPYNNSLATNGSDPDANSVLTYSKVSGPRWLIVAADGRISGLPAARDVGVNRFSVRVTDQTGLATDTTLNITVQSTADLVAHYQFHNSLINSVSSIFATASGSPSYVSGTFDNALNFDAIDDVVTLPANISSTLNDVTYALRFKWNGGGGWQRLLDLGNGTGQYLIITPSSGSNNTPQFAILNSGGTVQRLDAPEPIPVGEWTHLAVTLVGDTGTIYINGAAASTTTITLNPSSITQTTNYLGDSQFTADPLFAGTIDDFRIYNRGLNATEVSELVSPVAPVTVPLDYAGWTTGYAFAYLQNAANLDPDSDGMANGYEYLFGLNPIKANPNIMPTALIQTTSQLGLTGLPEKNYLSMNVRVRKERPGVSLIPEGSIDLNTFFPASASQAGSPTSDGDYEIFNYYLNTPMSDAPKGFLRLRAEFP